MNITKETLEEFHFQDKDQLRFILCGSVDDGKSTLLGRILFDSKAVLTDQIAAAEHESLKYGTQAGALDLALLVDGLQAEREQGITIDVAYRYFETDKRKFIAIDTPGHSEYTRNMATGASDATVAILMVDAEVGLLEQTFRHSYICALMGIEHLVLCVNKMDNAQYNQKIYTKLEADYQLFTEKLAELTGYQIAFTAIPISALKGVNIIDNCEMKWYQGKPLLHFLETFTPKQKRLGDFRFPVQWVNRPDSKFRGFSGKISSGKVRIGDEILIQPSMQKSVVKQILTPQGISEVGVSSQAVTLVLADNVDASRGDFFTHVDAPAHHADYFVANFIAMADQTVHVGRNYWLQTRNQLIGAHITDIRYQIDLNSLEHLASKSLEMNQIAHCHFKTDMPIIFEPYHENRDIGSFLLIDKTDYSTLGAGMIVHPLNRSETVVWHDMEINKISRGKQKQQKPCMIWFTGLSASGKSSIADRLEQELFRRNYHTYLLDGDNVRHGLNQDLGFSEEDRIENIRRVAEVAKLMMDAGLVTLVSFISPFRSERQLARELLEQGEFIEIFVDTPIEVCEQRDPKGLYQKARAGEIKNFTGLDSPYEPPEKPEIHLQAKGKTVEQLTHIVIDWLEQKGYLKP